MVQAKAACQNNTFWANLMKRLFLLLFIPLQACSSHFSGEVDKSISDSYYYIKGSEEIVYSPEGNWSEHGYEILDADKVTFRPIARDFGKDKNFIFYKAKKLPHIDYATFIIEEGATNNMKKGYPIEHFDVEVGSRSHGYARTGKSYARNKN